MGLRSSRGRPLPPDPTLCGSPLPGLDRHGPRRALGRHAEPGRLGRRAAAHAGGRFHRHRRYFGRRRARRRRRSGLFPAYALCGLGGESAVPLHSFFDDGPPPRHAGPGPRQHIQGPLSQLLHRRRARLHAGRQRRPGLGRRPRSGHHAPARRRRIHQGLPLGCGADRHRQGLPDASPRDGRDRIVGDRLPAALHLRNRHARPSHQDQRGQAGPRRRLLPAQLRRFRGQFLRHPHLRRRLRAARGLGLQRRRAFGPRFAERLPLDRPHGDHSPEQGRSDLPAREAGHRAGRPRALCFRRPALRLALGLRRRSGDAARLRGQDTAQDRRALPLQQLGTSRRIARLARRPRAQPSPAPPARPTFRRTTTGSRTIW